MRLFKFLSLIMVIASNYNCSKKEPEQEWFRIVTPSGKEIKKIYFDESYSLNYPEEYINTIKGFQESSTIKGHFVSQKIETTASIYYEEPKPNQDLSELKNKIIFSDSKLPEIDLGECTSVIFKNEGDLNGDGLDEIGYMLGYPNGSCRIYTVISYQNNKWKTVYNINTSLNMRAAGILPVEKMNGKVKLRMSIDGYLEMFPNQKLNKVFRTPYSCQESDVVEIIIK